MNQAEGTNRPNPPAPGKRTYAAPRLIVYGDLRILTEAKAMAGVDGGTQAGKTFSQ